jgi:hypothetical protein
MEFRKVMIGAAVAAGLTGCGSTEIRQAPVEATPVAPASDLHALSLGASNKLAGEVTLRNDASTLFVTVTAHDGFTVQDVRVCLGVSAFSYVNPEACGYSAFASGLSAKATVAIPLEHLGEPVMGDVIYVQAAAALREDRMDLGYAYAGTFKGRVGYTVSGHEVATDAACVLTADEWAGEKKEWPVTTVTVGGAEYRQDELITLLAAPSSGDASLMVAKQLIAARLNAASGVTLPVGVAAALVAMETWLPAQADLDGALPFQISATAEHLPNSSAFDDGVNTAEMIRQFNGGKLAAPACE